MIPSILLPYYKLTLEYFVQEGIGKSILLLRFEHGIFSKLSAKEKAFRIHGA